MKSSSILFCCALALLAAGCGTTTKVSLAWKDPAFADAGFDRILVIGIGENDVNRRVFEDHFAQLLDGRGVNASASYSLLPNTARLAEGAIREAVEGGHYDGVLITRLIGETQETEYIPPRTYTVPTTYYGGYYGYYNRSWDVVHEPGYYKTNTIVRLETNFYDVASGTLIWSGLSDTWNPRDEADTIQSATAAITKRLAKDGVIR